MKDQGGSVGLPPSPPKIPPGSGGPLRHWLMALTPAVLAHVVGMVSVNASILDEALWLPLCCLLLVGGAIVSGVLMVKAVSGGEVNPPWFVKSILFLAIFVLYLGAFAFSGCIALTLVS